MKIIRQNNYKLNNESGELWKMRNSIIGIIVPDITNPHFSALVLQMQMALFYCGYSTIICNTNESEVLEKKHIKTLRNHNVAGVIIVSGNRYHQALIKFPVVYVDRPHIGDDDDAIVIESDNEGGGYIAGKELLSVGCKKIVFLMSKGTDVNQVLRYNGFERALADKSDVCLNYVQNADNVSINAGKSIVVSLIQQGMSFDGIVATTDTLAVGAYLALREYGIKVPEQVKLIGFDDCMLAEACGVGLTSVKQDVAKMASTAVDLLIRQINGELITLNKYQMGVSLSKRTSTN